MPLNRIIRTSLYIKNTRKIRLAELEKFISKVVCEDIIIEGRKEVYGKKHTKIMTGKNSIILQRI